METLRRNIVSALIFSRDGKLLFGKKDPKGGGVYADCWHIPGGGVNKDEDRLQALRREISEEVGLDISKSATRLIDDQGQGESEKRLDSGKTVLCKMKFFVYEIRLN